MELLPYVEIIGILGAVVDLRAEVPNPVWNSVIIVFCEVHFRIIDAPCLSENKNSDFRLKSLLIVVWNVKVREKLKISYGR